jgi:hypothetical protein
MLTRLALACGLAEADVEMALDDVQRALAASATS